MTFDAEKAARLADELNAELSKLGEEPKELQNDGATLTICKCVLQPLAHNLRLGLYRYLEDSLPKTYEDFARFFKDGR